MWGYCRVQSFYYARFDATWQGFQVRCSGMTGVRSAGQPHWIVLPVIWRCKLNLVISVWLSMTLEMSPQHGALRTTTQVSFLLPCSDVQPPYVSTCFFECLMDFFVTRPSDLHLVQSSRLSPSQSTLLLPDSYPPASPLSRTPLPPLF